MPRFAANVAYLFTERPLLERFGAAAAAGFKAVELQFPYDHSASTVKAELAKHGLTQLGLNTIQGRDGEFGLAAVPGRERDFEAAFKQALDYAVAIGGSAVHCLAGKVPPNDRPAAERTFIANLTRAADLAQPHGITLLIEPINTRDRPDYFLNRVEHAADIIAKVGKPNVKIQYDFYHVQIVSGDLIKLATSPTRARSTIPRSLPPWTGWVGRASSPANTGRAAAPRTASLGRGAMGPRPEICETRWNDNHLPII